jgi:hypothetical protein
MQERADATTIAVGVQSCVSLDGSIVPRCATGVRTRQHRMPLTTEVRSGAGRGEWWTSTYEPDRSLHFRIAQLRGTGPVGKG